MALTPLDQERNKPATTQGGDVIRPAARVGPPARTASFPQGVGRNQLVLAHDRSPFGWFPPSAQGQVTHRSAYSPQKKFRFLSKACVPSGEWNRVDSTRGRPDIGSASATSFSSRKENLQEGEPVGFGPQRDCPEAEVRESLRIENPDHHHPDPFLPASSAARRRPSPDECSARARGYLHQQ